MPRWPVKNIEKEVAEYADSTQATTTLSEPEQEFAKGQDSSLVTAFLTAMRQMSAENRETTLAAIQELKKLSPEDQEKADREKQQLMEQTLRRVEAAKANEAAIQELQLGCAHTMPNG